jgi:hypothetical protein
MSAIDLEDKQACKADKDPAKKHDCNHVVSCEYFDNNHKQIWKRHSVLVVLSKQIRKGQRAVHSLLNQKDKLPIIPENCIHAECPSIVQKQKRGRHKKENADQGDYGDSPDLVIQMIVQFLLSLFSCLDCLRALVSYWSSFRR